MSYSIQDDRRPNEIAAYVCGLSLALSAVIARLICRLRSRTKLGLDDWTIFLTTLCMIAYVAIVALAIYNGEGRHIIFLKSLKSFIQEYIGSVICYSITVMLTKISILLFYRRIFELEWLRIVSCVLGLIVIAYNLAVILVISLQCIPLSSTWTGTPGRCIDKETPSKLLAIVNVITDVAILALPVRPVMRLQMETKRKVQIMEIFFLGGIVCIFGIVRCVVISKTKSGDTSWNIVFTGIWSFIEISVGVVAACLPTLAPLFKRSRPAGLES